MHTDAINSLPATAAFTLEFWENVVLLYGNGEAILGEPTMWSSEVRKKVSKRGGNTEQEVPSGFFTCNYAMD